MKIENLGMLPFNTSLMGVLKGVLDFYDNKVSAAIAFGGSGHAFFINIHEVICPSSPYRWKYDGFFRLAQNLGVEITDLGFFHSKSTAKERSQVEQNIKSSLDNGLPCSVLNMDNQTINGYDDIRFLLVQPWCTECDATPLTLTFKTWDEFGKEIHANFFSFKKIMKKDESLIIKESIKYALELFKNPDKYCFDKYEIGLAAYDNWIRGVEKGHGSSHGNWWNGTVWSECRHFAAEYFAEIAKKYGENVSGPAQELNVIYSDISDMLKLVSDKEMDSREKTRVLQELKSKEENTVKKLESFMRLFDK
jgi:hypothetical protein